MNRDQNIETLRWAATIPAALLGFAVGALLSSNIVLPMVTNLGAVGPPGQADGARYLLWLFPMGLLFVLAGALAAPHLNVAVAIAFGGIWVVWTGATHRGSWHSLVASIAGATAGVFLTFCVRRWRRGSRL